MKKIIEILSILDKKQADTLSEDEIASLFADDAELMSTFKKYKRITSAVRAQRHPNGESLTSYVLGELPENEAGLLAKHILDCSICDETVSELQSELNGVQLYLDRTIDKNHQSSFKKAKIFFLQSSPILRYAVAAVFVLGFAYSCIFAVSELTTSKNFTLGNLQSVQNFTISRGRESESFQEALYAIDQKDFSNAIIALKKDIAENGKDESIFYTHYILALTYYHAAYSAPIGLFPHYDKPMIRDAKKEFAECINLNKNPQLQNISLDAYFFSAKASIILNDIVSAKSDLQKVIDGKGSKMQEAKDLLLRTE